MWSTEAAEGQTYEEYVKGAVQESLEIMVLSEQHMDEYNVVLTDEEKELVAKAAAEFSEANTLENKEQVSGDDATVERVMTLLAIEQKVQNAIMDGADKEVSDDEAAQKSMEYVKYAYTSYDEDGNEVTVEDAEKEELLNNAKALAEAEDFDAEADAQNMSVQTLSFDAESTDLDAAVIEAADALAEGEVSEVIETETACYVVKLTSLFDRDATDAKKDEIVAERQDALYTEVMTAWMDETEIEVDEKVWESIDFNKLAISIVTDESEPYADEVQTDDVAE